MWWGRERSPDEAVDSNTGNLTEKRKKNLLFKKKKLFTNII